MSPFEKMLMQSDDGDRLYIPGGSVQLVNRGAPATVETAPVQLAAKPAAIVPSKSAPVGSRQWAACLLKEFGRDAGVRYVGLELTYMEALDLACDEHRQAQGLTPAAGEAERSQAKGFAGRVRFTPGMKIFGRRKGSAAKDPTKS